MATRTGAKKHTHKYHKLANGIWACALPDCTHYMPLNVEDNLPGKRTFCWACDRVMILDAQNMRLDKPLCVECDNPELASISEYLKDKGLV